MCLSCAWLIRLGLIEWNGLVFAASKDHADRRLSLPARARAAHADLLPAGPAHAPAAGGPAVLRRALAQRRAHRCRGRTVGAGPGSHRARARGQAGADAPARRRRRRRYRAAGKAAQGQAGRTRSRASAPARKPGPCRSGPQGHATQGPGSAAPGQQCGAPGRTGPPARAGGRCRRRGQHRSGFRLVGEAVIGLCRARAPAGQAEHHLQRGRRRQSGRGGRRPHGARRLAAVDSAGQVQRQCRLGQRGAARGAAVRPAAARQQRRSAVQYPDHVLAQGRGRLGPLPRQAAPASRSGRYRTNGGPIEKNSNKARLPGMRLQFQPAWKDNSHACATAGPYHE
ncbi:hypothetical protein CT19431_100005 [Cupriavidus taiwanensis]|nr:hypothetical protein CT19431_100005 [Cupriavidus taiwanensis]